MINIEPLIVYIPYEIINSIFVPLVKLHYIIALQLRRVHIEVHTSLGDFHRSQYFNNVSRKRMWN